VKRVAAEVNSSSGLLDRRRMRAIVRAADEVIAGGLDDHFRSCLADRFRDPDQHECERGDRQRANELLGGQSAPEAGASNDHVQSQPVVERQLPDRHGISRRHRDRRAALRPSPSALRRSTPKQALRQDRQDRTHPPCRMRRVDAGQEFSGYDRPVASGMVRIGKA